MANHFGFEMANGAGDDLFDGGEAAGEALGVVVGGEIADEGGDVVILFGLGEDAFEECGFAAARAGDEADNEDAGIVELLAELAGDDVILFEDFLAHFDEAGSWGWGEVHSEISMAHRSSSRPLATSEVAVPQIVQDSC